jgi:hypothetical protein
MEKLRKDMEALFQELDTSKMRFEALEARIASIEFFLALDDPKPGVDRSCPKCIHSDLPVGSEICAPCYETKNHINFVKA